MPVFLGVSYTKSGTIVSVVKSSNPKRKDRSMAPQSSEGELFYGIASKVPAEVLQLSTTEILRRVRLKCENSDGTVEVDFANS